MDEALSLVNMKMKKIYLKHFFISKTDFCCCLYQIIHYKYKFEQANIQII